MAMLYNFGTMRTELTRRLGGRVDTTTRDRADRWLDSAQLQFAKCFIELPLLEQVVEGFSVVEGTSEYNLSSSPFFTFGDIIGIRSVRNNTANQPLRMHRFPFESYRAISQQAESMPVRWSRKGTLFVVDPKPDDQYELTIDYRRRPQLGVIELDSEWHEAMLNYATFIGWNALSQPNLAQSALNAIPASTLRDLQTPIPEEEWEAYWDQPGFQPAASGFTPMV